MVGGRWRQNTVCPVGTLNRHRLQYLLFRETGFQCFSQLAECIRRYLVFRVRPENRPCQPLAVLGRGYIRARTDATQETNICLGIHRQTRVATVNPTCLSRLITTAAILSQNQQVYLRLGFTLAPHYGTFVTYKVYDKYLQILVTTFTILI